MSSGSVREVLPWQFLAPAETFTALLVDNHAYIREAMVVRLRQLGAGEITEAASIDEARVRTHIGGPRDLCLLDFGVLAADADVLRDLRGAGWQRVLLLSAADDPFALRAAFVAGVRGYLLAPPAAETSDGSPGRPGTGPRGPTSTLSQREIEVLGLVSQGRSNRDTARAMKLSALTVKSHLARIARKLDTGDRAEMVIIALRAGAIP